MALSHEEFLQIRALEPPLDRPKVRAGIVSTLRRLEAMGLLRAQKIPSLGLAHYVVLLGAAAERGIGKDVVMALGNLGRNDDEQVAPLVDAFNSALLDSPVPDTEWTKLEDVLGLPLLAELVGASASSVRRYAKGTRPTPADVADRLHFLAMVVSDLSGAYNELGIRAWFGRRRRLLDGMAPKDLLRDDWQPEDEGPFRVRELAASLTMAPAA